jgi:hypothetical protein
MKVDISLKNFRRTCSALPCTEVSQEEDLGNARRTDRSFWKCGESRRYRDRATRYYLCYEMLASARKRLLSIFSARILDSSVERGIPSRAAAPEGPNTRPRLARSASSTIAFSCAASELDNPIPTPNRRPRGDSQLSSTVNSSVPRRSRTAR